MNPYDRFIQLQQLCIYLTGFEFNKSGLIQNKTEPNPIEGNNNNQEEPKKKPVESDIDVDVIYRQGINGLASFLSEEYFEVNTDLTQNVEISQNQQIKKDEFIRSLHSEIVRIESFKIEDLNNYKQVGFRLRDSANGFIDLNSSRIKEWLKAVCFHREIFNRINLMLLTGEYIGFLEAADHQKFEGAITLSSLYIPRECYSWSEDNEIPENINASPEINSNAHDARKKSTTIILNAPKGRLLLKKNRNEPLKYLLIELIADLCYTAEENLYNTTASTERHSSTANQHLNRYNTTDYILHQLYRFTRLNYRVAYLDHTLRASEQMLTELTLIKEELMGFVSSHPKNFEQLIFNFKVPDNWKPQNLLPTLHPGELKFWENCLTSFTEEVNKKFTPQIRALVEKTDYLIRKLIDRVTQKTIANNKLISTEHYEVPLYFNDRKQQYISEAEHQLVYIFQNIKRYRFNYSDGVKNDESLGGEYEIKTLREKLFKSQKEIGDIINEKSELDKKKLTFLKIDEFQYLARYYRDIHPDLNLLKVLRDTFDLYCLSKIIELVPTVSSNNIYDKMSMYYMQNYLHNSYFSRYLTGKFDKRPDFEDARKELFKIERIQQETNVYNYFPYYKFVLYLKEELELHSTEEKRKTSKTLHLQLSESLATCRRYLTLCNNNGFHPFKLPFKECRYWLCYNQKSGNTQTSINDKLNNFFSGSNSEEREMVVHMFMYQEHINDKKINFTKHLNIPEGISPKENEEYWPLPLFISSSIMIPQHYRQIEQQFDVIKGEISDITLNYITSIRDRIAEDAKAHREDMFKFFGWFASLVIFAGGVAGKISSSAKSTPQETIMFIVGFGICQLAFVLTIYGLTLPRSERFFGLLESYRVYIQPRTRRYDYWWEIKNIFCFFKFTFEKLFKSFFLDFLSSAGTWVRFTTFGILLFVMYHFYSEAKEQSDCTKIEDKNDSVNKIHNEYKPININVNSSNTPR